ncbi:MAG: hypothetical protein ACM3JD_09200, partial [Rudaea sp.]
HERIRNGKPALPHWIGEGKASNCLWGSRSWFESTSPGKECGRLKYPSGGSLLFILAFDLTAFSSYHPPSAPE